MGCSVSHPVTKDSRPSDYSYHPVAPRKNTPGRFVNQVSAFATTHMTHAPSVGKILAISPYSRNRVLQAAALQLSKELLVVQSMRITMQVSKAPRKTKIGCSLGAQNTSDAALGQLLDDGVDLFSFNASTTSPAEMQSVLNRLRVLANTRKLEVATMMDTAGPGTRTGELHQQMPLQLTIGEEVHLRGENDFTALQSIRNADGQAIIIIFHELLAEIVRPGSKISIDYGRIVLSVTEVVQAQSGQRQKRPSVPGSPSHQSMYQHSGSCSIKARVIAADAVLKSNQAVHFPGEIQPCPVTTENGMRAIRKFACANHLDFVTVSYCQAADDARFVRRLLVDHDGRNIGLLAKIENWAGIDAVDDILQEADGIIICRDNLSVEVGSDCLPLLLKIMIAKAASAGKMAVVSGQVMMAKPGSPGQRMPASDIADTVMLAQSGADMLMLSDRDALGRVIVASRPASASTLSSVKQVSQVCVAAECMLEGHSNSEPVSPRITSKPLTDVEALLHGAAAAAVDCSAGLVVVISNSVVGTRLLAKQRTSTPILLVTESEEAARQCRGLRGVHALVTTSVPIQRVSMSSLNCGDECEPVLDHALNHAVQAGLCREAMPVIVLVEQETPDGRFIPSISLRVTRGDPRESADDQRPEQLSALRCPQMAFVTLDALKKAELAKRKTKMLAMIDRSTTPECVSQLLQLGLDMACFQVGEGLEEQQQLCAAVEHCVAARDQLGSGAGIMLCTAGSEIQTCPLRDDQQLILAVGDEVVLCAPHGAAEMPRDGTSASLPIIACTAAHLRNVLVAKGKVAIADGPGAVWLECTQVLDHHRAILSVTQGGTVRGDQGLTFPDNKEVHVAISQSDLSTASELIAKGCIDYMSISSIDSAEDVRQIRNMLSQSGASHIGIIADIAHNRALADIDHILREADGIIFQATKAVLHMPAESIPMAQRWLATKARMAGKLFLAAPGISLAGGSNPLAEQSSLAAACLDCSHGVLLERLHGAVQPRQIEAAWTSVKWALQRAEIAGCHPSATQYIRDAVTLKAQDGPEAIAYAAVRACIDSEAALIITISQTGHTAALIARLRPPVTQIVVTSNASHGRRLSGLFGAEAFVVEYLDSVAGVMEPAKEAARSLQLLKPGQMVVQVHGRNQPDADGDTSCAMQLVS